MEEMAGVRSPPLRSTASASLSGPLAWHGRPSRSASPTSPTTCVAWSGSSSARRPLRASEHHREETRSFGRRPQPLNQVPNSQRSTESGSSRRPSAGSRTFEGANCAINGSQSALLPTRSPPEVGDLDHDGRAMRVNVVRQLPEPRRDSSLQSRMLPNACGLSGARATGSIPAASETPTMPRANIRRSIATGMREDQEARTHPGLSTTVPSHRLQSATTPAAPISHRRSTKYPGSFLPGSSARQRTGISGSASAKRSGPAITPLPSRCLC